MSSWEQVVFRCSILIKVCLPTAPAHHFNNHFKHTINSRREWDSHPRSILYSLSSSRLPPQALLLLPTTPLRPVKRVLRRLGTGTISTRLPPSSRYSSASLKVTDTPSKPSDSYFVKWWAYRGNVTESTGRSGEAPKVGGAETTPAKRPRSDDHDLTRNHHHGFKCCCHHH